MNTSIGIDLAMFYSNGLQLRPLTTQGKEHSVRIWKFSMASAVAIGLTGVVATGVHAQAETLNIAAAYSLKPAFNEIITMFEKEYGVPVHVVYGSSQTLSRQIENGEPIDVFFPASFEEVEKLYKKGLTLKRKPRIYAQTSLVLVMSAASVTSSISFHDVLPNRVRIALGDPKTSVLGEITARTLTSLDPAYKYASNLIYGQHSVDVMSLITTRRADVGIIYRSDAINSGQMRIIDETPAGKYTAIQLGESMVWTCREASLDNAEEFLDFMMSPRIQKLLLKHGFDPVSSKE
jgi:molybdate transport system substrate-binding protein